MRPPNPCGHTLIVISARNGLQSCRPLLCVRMSFWGTQSTKMKSEKCILEFISSSSSGSLCAGSCDWNTEDLNYSSLHNTQWHKAIKRGCLRLLLLWINLRHMLNSNNRFSCAVSPPSLADLTPHYGVPRGPISLRVNHCSSRRSQKYMATACSWTVEDKTCSLLDTTSLQSNWYGVIKYLMLLTNCSYLKRLLA